MESEGMFNLEHRDALEFDIDPSCRFKEGEESMLSSNIIKTFNTIKSTNNLSLQKPIINSDYDLMESQVPSKSFSQVGDDASEIHK